MTRLSTSVHASFGITLLVSFISSWAGRAHASVAPAFLALGCHKDLPAGKANNDGKRRTFDIFVPSSAAQGRDVPVVVASFRGRPPRRVAWFSGTLPPVEEPHVLQA